MNNPLFKIPFRYGLFGGVICSIVIAVLYFIGRHPFLVPGIFDFRIILFAVFIFFSLKELRERYLQGVLFYWQGMTGSYIFLITTALIGSVFTWGLAKWNEGFLPSYIEKLQQQMNDNKEEIIVGIGKAAYDQQMTKLPLTSAMDLAADYFLKSMIIGLFLAILMSVILRKQPKTN